MICKICKKTIEGKQKTALGYARQYCSKQCSKKALTNNWKMQNEYYELHKQAKRF